ncbi:MAG: BNR repeat-containing protein, partial [Firmicutes bacterium]|nr:BNR repeat-containing protein [Bacillota bacterium]
MLKRIYFALAVFIITSSSLYAELSVRKTGDSIVSDQSLTILGIFGNYINGHSFQQDAVISHNGYQYVGYYNSNRRVCIARRQLPDGPWEQIEFTDYYFGSNDGHNTISVGICQNDGTIHIAFDHHNHALNYKISQTGVTTNPSAITWDDSLFSEVRDYLEPGKTIENVTYPAFFKTPSGDMQMVYRYGYSGNGDWVIVDYSGNTHQWSNNRMFISRAGTFTDEYNTSAARCAYPNHYMYGPNGKLHVTWVWRENTQGANHDIMYAYSEDGGTTWLNDKSSTMRIVVNGENPQTLLNIKGAS